MSTQRAGRALLLAQLLFVAAAVPSGFPKSGNGLWYKTPGKLWANDYLPVGNGYLAATTPGGSTYETLQLNIESLWSGGPFQDPSYNGGNSPPSEREKLANEMQRIRQTIFQSSSGTIGDIEVLAVDQGKYGSYAGTGYFVSTVNSTGDTSDYARWLDLDQAVARTTWSQSGSTFLRETFCSHPTQACTQHLSSTNQGSKLPSQTFTFSLLSESGMPTPNVTCFNNQTLQVRGFASSPGMLYEILARVQSPGATVSCAPTSVTNVTTANATITVTSGASDAWLTWVGGTEFDQNAGDAAHGFSFHGADPHDALVGLLDTAAGKDYGAALSEHGADVDATLHTFELTLGSVGDVGVLDATDAIKAAYRTGSGNTWLEWVLFNYGRYMLWSSARGILPANLQGKWGDASSNPWSSDYHSNINIQMNYWFAEMSNLDVTKPLFDYFEKNWAPRGAQTALTLYNISRGWVTHNEMNIFGHSGMKGGGNTAQWADYPESAVWMMIHAWDHFDYTNDIDWWRAQGWPLVKGVASFHLDKLILDLHFNDSTLVTAPCNSPEQGPITFGCAHAQQLIWQLFNAVEKGFAASGDTDTVFLDEVRSKRAKMDKGIHVGKWGQLQEWKFDMDNPSDTHRHLSHLIGLYPGYAVASYNPGLQPASGSNGNYTRQNVLDAAQTSLIHRGNGTGPDGDAGWEKMWRAACWAQFGDKDKFYHQLSYAIERNFGSNLFSLYNPGDEHAIFQIDANLGYPAAVLNALVQAPDTPSLDDTLTVTLLPALPAHWSSGKIRGARLRGGVSLDLAWNDGRLTEVLISPFRVASGPTARQVEVVYNGHVVGRLDKTSGNNVKITQF